jgi:hypothetical protein
MNYAKKPKNKKFLNIFIYLTSIIISSILMLKIYSSSQVFGIRIPLSIGNIIIILICIVLIITSIIKLLQSFFKKEKVIDETSRSKMISDMINEKEKLNGIIESYEIVINQLRKDNAELREQFKE